MNDVVLIKGLVGQLAALSFVVAGFALMINGLWPGARRWAGRFGLLGILLAVVAGMITSDWLP